MGGSKKADVGTWYYVAIHFVLGYPADALLGWHVGDKTAWSGRVVANTGIPVRQANLLGGEKDQGGVEGTLRVEFGGDDQLPNAYLTSVFGPQTVAWRGFTTVAWEGGKYGANNPYPQPSSFTGEWIKAMWEGGCWYPTVADIPLSFGTYGADTYNLGQRVIVPSLRGLCTRSMAEVEGLSYTETEEFVLAHRPNESGLSFIKLDGESDATAVAKLIARGLRYDETALLKYYSGALGLVILTRTSEPPAGPWGLQPTSPFTTSIGLAYLWNSGVTTAAAATARAMNPAHILYYLQTQPGRGGEPTANMDDVNLRAAADWYYAQRFGLCCTRKAASESPAEFIRKIEQVAGCSFVRSPVTGKFRINIANGEYDRASLQVLTDDDVLSFKEIPTIPAEAINSVSVRYRDPLVRQTITTAPVRALALIAAFGERHQTLDYPQIPDAATANRVALRELLGFITPTRKFELDTKSTTDGYERGQYFHLQLVKRSIDMVCEVGEIQYGSLKSGGNQLVAVQDTIRVPDGSYVETEPGIDTRPSQAALPIGVQAAFEAPYIEVCQRLARAELAALPDDVGYLIAAAADPGDSRDFTLVADAGGGYADVGYGDFCPAATVITAANQEQEGPFELEDGYALALIQVGDPALWGVELCRVNAIDAAALTVTLGRGCGDTVGRQHAAGERVIFYAAADSAYDATEYTDGEMILAKLLTNTASERLDESVAEPIVVEFAGRQARPYPPAAPRLNGEAWPEEIFETADVSWLHRDRAAQADKLVDQKMASIGPEPGTTYTVRWFLNGTLAHAETGITGSTASYAPTADGALRVEIEAVRGGLASWQMQVIECIYRTSHYSTYIDHGGDTYVDQAGNYYIG